MHRPGKFGQDSLRDDAVQLAQNQPLCATGATGDSADPLLREAACLDILVGRRARLEAQCSVIQLICSIRFRLAYDPDTEAVRKGAPRRICVGPGEPLLMCAILP